MPSREDKANDQCKSHQARKAWRSSRQKMASFGQGVHDGFPPIAVQDITTRPNANWVKMINFQ
jgi:hypothetical protein